MKEFGESLSMEFKLLSKAFKNEEMIPDIYSNTPKGKNISPPLNWETPPENTKTFAIIVEDVDAPLVDVITHWVVYNIQSEKKELEAGIPRQISFPNGMNQGVNFSKRNEYMGPKPPFGTHRYYFKIYALDIKIPMDPKMTRKQLLKEMNNHILDQAQLIGIYSKK